MTNTNTPTTVGEFNSLFAKHNIPQLTPAQFEHLKRIRKRDHLLTAVAQMSFDQNSLVFIRAAVQEVLEEFGGSAPTNNQQQAQGQRQPDNRSQNYGDGRNSEPPQRDSRSSTPSRARGSNGEGNGDGKGRHAEERFSFHVYGGKAALCFETDTTRGGVHTIALDAAPVVNPREYDWNSKIRIQLTRQEMPIVAAVLFGLHPSCEFKNHGPEKDKGFFIEAQPGKFFVKVFAKGAKHAVPMEVADAYRVATLFLRQLRKDSPWMTAGDILTTIRAVVAGRLAAARNDNGNGNGGNGNYGRGRGGYDPTH